MKGQTLSVISRGQCLKLVHYGVRTYGPCVCWSIFGRPHVNLVARAFYRRSVIFYMLEPVAADTLGETDGRERAKTVLQHLSREARLPGAPVCCVIRPLRSPSSAIEEIEVRESASTKPRSPCATTKKKKGCASMMKGDKERNLYVVSKAASRSQPLTSTRLGAAN